MEVENTKQIVGEVLEKVKYVTKRNGEKQSVDTAQIKERLNKLSFGMEKKYLDLDLVVQKVIQGMHDGITTSELDSLAAETCAYMNIIHPHYSQETKESFAETIKDLFEYIDGTGRKASLISEDVFQIVQKNAERIQQEIRYERDFTYDFFGFKTLERSYLLRLGGKVAERPQHLLMRVSIGIHKEDLESAFETYHLMSDKWFTHATPTLFYSGTPMPQMSSCFLLTMTEDSIYGIYETLKRTALISKA
eukprot:CAMPEP_0176466032 /NCGR_PEP_ID=MMETSP0127-20121128/37648_1 /TAXON_ID=938130 /ORGANISM="Platyophrya macrostoma, Strain WH" /LENGTH=248 /DNA_ID=CAMNT_0017859117 /DNA_START=8 /DNA_END=751 /DNA_ORIENTATION=+